MTPELSLAFAIHSAPGVYALLLGSGISRTARIPTGWEVVLDLIRKLAVVEGADCGSDPAGWYREKFGGEPGYSQILDALAKTPAERQQILRAYFEPSESERLEGAKAPTKAHRAIASLVASGHLRVILTTNFDRLMERALEDVGVAPVVISTVDQLEGAPPLAHMKSCVIKLHGDYQDARILNTPDELAGYDPKMDKFLDRVFDEFGLVACGWSADWDDALRAAIERAPNRRYSTYFAAVQGKAGDRANELLTRRAGQVIAIADGDSFFEALEQKVRAIEQFSQPHPLSVKAAVGACKRYLSEPDVFRIRLADLIADESRRVATELKQGSLNNTSETVNTATVTSRVRKYEGACQTLIAIAFQIGRWGDINAARQVADALRRLYATKEVQGSTLWLAYQGYPVTLITYAAMLGASFEARCDVIAQLLTAELELAHKSPVLTVDVAPPFCLLDDPQGWGRFLEGLERRQAPLNDWLCSHLWREFGDEFASQSDFNLKFDWAEIVLAMANHKLCPPSHGGDFHPPGSYVYRHENRERVTKDIKANLNARADQSLYVSSQLFGATAAEVSQAVDRLLGWANGRVF